MIGSGVAIAIALALGCLVLGVQPSDDGADAGASDAPVEVATAAGGSVSGRVVGTDHDGVTLLIEMGTDAPDSRRVIPWLAVREREGSWRVPEAWREAHARSVLGMARHERGDRLGAGEILGPIAPALIGSDAAQAHAVLGAMLDAALIRGAIPDAAAWMVAPGEANPGWDQYEGRYGLHTGVPLVRGLSTGVSTGVRSPFGVDDDMLSARDRVILAMFRVVDADDAGGVEDALGRADAIDGDPGIELLSLMLRAQAHPDAETRARARERLESRSRMRAGGWIEAWARLAIAGSHFRERTREHTARGLVALTHVIARLRNDHPALARLAMRRFRAACERAGMIEELDLMERVYGGAVHAVTTTDGDPSR